VATPVTEPHLVCLLWRGAFQKQIGADLPAVAAAT